MNSKLKGAAISIDTPLKFLNQFDTGDICAELTKKKSFWKIHKKIENADEFIINKGWLTRWKNRHRIHFAYV